MGNILCDLDLGVKVKYLDPKVKVKYVFSCKSSSPKLFEVANSNFAIAAAYCHRSHDEEKTTGQHFIF